MELFVDEVISIFSMTIRWYKRKILKSLHFSVKKVNLLRTATEDYVDLLKRTQDS